MKNDHPTDLPQGRLKIDRLGTGRGRSGAKPEEQMKSGRRAAFLPRRGRRGESRSDPER